MGLNNLINNENLQNSYNSLILTIQQSCGIDYEINVEISYHQRLINYRVIPLPNQSRRSLIFVPSFVPSFMPSWSSYPLSIGNIKNFLPLILSIVIVYEANHHKVQSIYMPSQRPLPGSHCCPHHRFRHWQRNGQIWTPICGHTSLHWHRTNHSKHSIIHR